MAPIETPEPHTCRGSERRAEMIFRKVRRRKRGLVSSPFTTFGTVKAGRDATSPEGRQSLKHGPRAGLAFDLVFLVVHVAIPVIAAWSLLRGGVHESCACSTSTVGKIGSDAQTAFPIWRGLNCCRNRVTEETWKT